MVHILFILMGIFKFQFVIFSSTLYMNSFVFTIDCFISAILNIFIFTNLGKDIKILVSKIFKMKRISKTTRFLVKVKKRSGLGLIAFITPVVLGYPIGCAVMNSLTRNRWRIYQYLLLSSVFWISLLYLIGTFI